MNFPPKSKLVVLNNRELHLYNMEGKDSLRDLVIVPTVTQFNYNCFEKIFAIDFENLWEIEKHYFLENLVKIVNPTISFQVDSRERPKVPESLAFESNFGSPKFSMTKRGSLDSPSDKGGKRTKSGSKQNSFNGDENIDKPSEHEFNVNGSNDIPSEHQLYWRSSSIRKVRLITVAFEPYETFFRHFYVRDVSSHGYLTLLTVAVLQSSPENQIGIKIFCFSSATLKTRGIFLAVNQLLWKKPNVKGQSVHLSESSQASEQTDSLTRYVMDLETKDITDKIELESVDEFYQKELRIDKFKIVAGHEVSFQSMDRIFDLSK